MTVTRWFVSCISEEWETSTSQSVMMCSGWAAKAGTAHL